MKAGEFKVRPELEEAVWMDRKRIMPFALPWSFTKYIITPTRIQIQSGILNTKEEETMLFRVRDTSLSQSLIERLNGTGTITITSTDATMPTTKLIHVKDPRSVKELLVQMVEKARTKNRVRAVEGIAGDDPDTEGSETELGTNEGIFDA